MKAEHLNPFTEAAAYVLKEVLSDLEISRGALEVKQGPMITRGVATLIGITGQLRGHVIYDMDRKTALDLASAMNGEKLAGMNALVRSTINELANMISGNAASRLAGAGYRCDITPPTFIVGEQSEIFAFKGVQHLIVPIETPFGRVSISLAIQEPG